MNLHIPCANVFDIRSLINIPEYNYFFDTNILKFIFAQSVANDKSYQTEYYPKFLKILLQKKLIIFTYIHNIIELFAVLDKIDMEFLKIKNVLLKDYRISNLEQYQDTRKIILDEVSSAINIFSKPIEIGFIHSYLNLPYSIDISDYIYYKLDNDSKIAFVTDDYEFINIENINVFTANTKAIQYADRVKKLIKN